MSCYIFHVLKTINAYDNICWKFFKTISYDKFNDSEIILKVNFKSNLISQKISLHSFIQYNFPLFLFLIYVNFLII